MIDDGTTISGVIDVDISTVILNNKALRAARTSFAKDRISRVYDKLFLGRRCDCRMYFHNPFFDERIDYDVNNFVGVSDPCADNLDQFIEWFRQMEFRHRIFSLGWSENNRIYVACRSDLDPRPWPRTEPDRFLLSWDSPQLTANIARLCQGIPQFNAGNKSVDDISYETCIDLFERCFDFFTAKLGTRPALRLYTWLKVESGIPLVGPKVWDYWDCIWAPLKGHKVYKPPVNTGLVRAYPIVVIQNRDKLDNNFVGELYCAVNCVHARGKTYVEVQARDTESVQFISDFYCASVDVWRGSMEDRFGWYGDASRGTTYRIDPKTTAAAFSGDKVPTFEKVFVASPKMMQICPDGKVRDACEIYQRPVAIGSSLFELRFKGITKGLDVDGVLNADEILQNTFGNNNFMETCDWSQYPKVVQQNALELGGLGLNEPFPERIAETNVWSELTYEAQSKLVQLLNLGMYRIIELRVTSEDRKKLSRAIASKKVSQATDQWIAGLLNQVGV